MSGGVAKYVSLPVEKWSTRDLRQNAHKKLFELMRPYEVFNYQPARSGRLWGFECMVGGCVVVRHGFVDRWHACLAVVEHRADVHSLPASVL